jgi:hypothetical protein
VSELFSSDTIRGPKNNDTVTKKLLAAYWEIPQDYTIVKDAITMVLVKVRNDIGMEPFLDLE